MKTRTSTLTPRLAASLPSCRIVLIAALVCLGHRAPPALAVQEGTGDSIAASGDGQNPLEAGKDTKPVTEGQARSLVAALLNANTLAEMKSLLTRFTDVAMNPDAAATVQSLIDRDANTPVDTKRFVSLMFGAMFQECPQAGVDKAALNLAIRSAALGATTAQTPAQLRERLQKGSPDFVTALDGEVVAAALVDPKGLVSEQRLPVLKQLFHDWKSAGVDMAVQGYFKAANTASGSSQGGSGSSGKDPVSAAAVVGKWSAAVIGQATGMSIQSYYQFSADGSYLRSTSSVFDFGADGTAVGGRGPKGGNWVVEDRVLRLTPNDGQPWSLEIKSFSDRGMITQERNGDRRIWQKIR